VALGAALAGAYVAAPATEVGLVREVLAGSIAGVGIAVGLAALIRLRHSFQVAPSPRSDGRLEAGGIYRWLRHPMYVSVLGLIAAVAVLQPTALVLAAAVANYLFYRVKARYEEARLRRHYPNYEAYRRHTVGI
jgi:protein-S-isoprenylcysteine O-methyltransferase Ste14